MSTETAADTRPGDELQERVEQFRALRAQLERMVLPLAHSLDGRRFEWQAPLHGASLRVGGYVVLRDAGGDERLGQILDARLVEEAAGELGVAAAGGNGSTLRSTVSLRLVRGHGAVLHGAAGPFSDAAHRAATADEIAAWRAQAGGKSAPLAIGSLAAASEVPASIDARGFGRHTFLCGQSGSGKTYSLGVVLDRLLAATSLRIVILDPNSDFTALGRVRDGAPAEAAERHREVATGIRVRSAGSGPDRLHVPFPALADEDRAALLRLDPIADREEYAELLDLLGEQRPASWDDLEGDAGGDRRLTQRVKNLKLHTLGIWSRGDSGSILDDLERDDVRCLVVDLGSLPTRTEAALAAEAVLATLWRRREERKPVLVVIDEAHNVCPAEAADAVTARATEHVVRIAAEGRKFGLHLLLCTQRPQKLPENALTQCDNLVLMRLNARADLAFIEDAFSFVPAGLIGLASGFGLGEALVAGKIAPDPLLLRFGQRVSEEGGGDVPATWA
jgi:hypothetical protein